MLVRSLQNKATGLASPRAHPQLRCYAADTPILRRAGSHSPKLPERAAKAQSSQRVRDCQRPIDGDMSDVSVLVGVIKAVRHRRCNSAFLVAGSDSDWGVQPGSGVGGGFHSGSDAFVAAGMGWATRARGERHGGGFAAAATCAVKSAQLHQICARC